MTAEAPARQPGRSRLALPWTIRVERRLEVPRWLPVATTIAVLGWLFFAGKSVQAVLMAQRGAFDATVLAAALPLAAAGTAGVFAGLRLRARFDPSRYRGWLKATLAAVAAWLVLRVALGVEG